MKNLLYILLFFVCCSCIPDKNWKKEIIETYTVRRGDMKYHRDQLIYKEVNYYSEDDRLVERRFFNKDGSEKATEVYAYDANGQCISSDYIDPSGAKLSYYEFFYDAEGNRIRSVAYEAESGELLRIERFEYDDLGNRTMKEILDANSIVNQSFRFGFDEMGNETSMAAIDANNELIFTETHDITSRDPDGKWKLSWGFRDKIPKTVRYRETEKIEALK